MLCTACHTGNPAEAADCRVCGAALPVDPAKKAKADARKRAAEIADLTAKIAAKKKADEDAAAEAAAMATTEAELEDLKRAAEEAGVA